MSYFDSLLERRGIDECPLPLWKLKLKDEEYEELRSLLSACTCYHSLTINPFNALARETTLFFAEFWKREYSGGAHRIQVVYSALNPMSNSKDYQDQFYDAARQGAMYLGIDRYVGGRDALLEDMLYQGGLPLGAITRDINNIAYPWNSFARRLVNLRIDFDDLNFTRIAKQSQSIKDYSRQLIIAIEKEQYWLMPFDCDNENNVWYQALCELARLEHKRQKELKPFSLKWEFEVDILAKPKRIKKVEFVVAGPRKLSNLFLEQNQLPNQTFFSAQVRVNGRVLDTFNFINNFCRYDVISKHLYHLDDNIELFLHDHESPLFSDELDMNVPHILFCNEYGKYEIGNKMGTHEGLILFPEDWTVENESQYVKEEFLWEGEETTLYGIRLAADATDDITFNHHEDGQLTFGKNAELYWTEIENSPIDMPSIEEPIYDAENCSYLLCYDSRNGEQAMRHRDVVYRSKRQGKWSYVPAYGEIFARIKSDKFVTPKPFINIGDGLEINILSANEDTCCIKVSWAHGRVHTREGIRQENDTWLINKQGLANPRKIHFIFTPTDNYINRFELTVKAPFVNFTIDDIYEMPIQDDCWIPYEDLDKYQYHLVGGQKNKSFSFGNTEKTLFWYDNNLYISENGVRTPIPYEGSLSTLFGPRSRKILRSLLDKTSKDMVNAEVNVLFRLDGGRRLTFSIKDSPYQVKQKDGGRIEIVDKNDRPAHFKSALKLIKLDEPEKKSVKVTFDEENGYVLPEEIRPWGKALLCGSTRGQICPTILDLNGDNSDNAFKTIMNDLSQSHMDDAIWKRIIGWFNRVQKEGIPANSLLELECVARSAEHLLYLAFLLYIDCHDEDSTDVLKEQLGSLSADLAFQWYWVKPKLKGFAKILQTFIDLKSPIFVKAFISWALRQENPAEYLSSLNTDQYSEKAVLCMSHLLNSFDNWMKELCVSSMLESYDDTGESSRLLAECIINDRNLAHRKIDGESYIENNQEGISKETADFFNRYAPNTGKNSPNEIWFKKRVNAVAAQLTDMAGDRDLFAQPDEIRRSVIYCNKSNVNRFVTELNNKLIEIKQSKKTK